MNLYEEAAKCLYKIASRKCAKSIETPIVVSLFRDAPMQRILTAANLGFFLNLKFYGLKKFF